MTVCVRGRVTSQQDVKLGEIMSNTTKRALAKSIKTVVTPGGWEPAGVLEGAGQFSPC